MLLCNKYNLKYWLLWKYFSCTMSSLSVTVIKRLILRISPLFQSLGKCFAKHLQLQHLTAQAFLKPLTLPCFLTASTCTGHPEAGSWFTVWDNPGRLVTNCTLFSDGPTPRAVTLFWAPRQLCKEVFLSKEIPNDLNFLSSRNSNRT